MSVPFAKYFVYFVYSAFNDDNIGIWWLYHQQPEQKADQKFVGQPVRVKVDLVEVFRVLSPTENTNLKQPVVGDHAPTRRRRPRRLGPGPYKYTNELEGEVFATNTSGAEREWFLIPGNGEDIYL